MSTTIRVEWREWCRVLPDGTTESGTYDPPRVEDIDTDEVERVVGFHVGVIR